MSLYLKINLKIILCYLKFTSIKKIKTSHMVCFTLKQGEVDSTFSGNISKNLWTCFKSSRTVLELQMVYILCTWTEWVYWLPLKNCLFFTLTCYPFTLSAPSPRFHLLNHIWKEMRTLQSSSSQFKDLWTKDWLPAPHIASIQWGSGIRLSL